MVVNMNNYIDELNEGKVTATQHSNLPDPQHWLERMPLD